MYSFDWLERLRLNRAERGAPATFAMSPVIWGLGFTSLLTDVSAEMVSSVLPAYLFLHLKLGPMLYGIIDGLYNGFAVALVSVAAGLLADRHRRHRLLALLGYLLSALCDDDAFNIIHVRRECVGLWQKCRFVQPKPYIPDGQRDDT